MIAIKHAVGRAELHCTYLSLHPLKHRSRRRKKRKKIKNKRGKGKVRRFRNKVCLLIALKWLDNKTFGISKMVQSCKINISFVNICLRFHMMVSKQQCTSRLTPVQA